MNANVAVIGFGYVGACIGAVLASKKYHVVGVDTNPDLVETINRGEVHIHEPGLGDLVRQGAADGYLSATTDLAAVADADVVIMAVGTPMDDFEPDTRQVAAACRELARHLKKGQLVILKSTVPPYTTEDLVKPILEESGLTAGEDFHLAFCPERLAEGRALHELQLLPIVVGGVNEASTTAAGEFWEEALGLPTIRVSNARTAEMSKLADNLWIDLAIAIGNELALLSEKLDIDVLEVIEAANSLPKGAHHVNILTPSVGVGGSCLTKDPWFVDHIAREHDLELQLPATGRRVNEEMPRHSVQLISDALTETGRDLKDAKVAVLGVAFKNNTGDVRLTPTEPVIRALESSGCDLRVYDPLVTDNDMAEITGSAVKDVHRALEDADCVAFLTGHDEFRRLDLSDIAHEVSSGAVIFDGRFYFTRQQIDQMKDLGLRYQGIGR